METALGWWKVPNKYNLELRQKQPAPQKNTIYNLDRYILTLSISINWKHVLLLGPKASLPLEISFIVLSPTCPLFCHLVKYILPLGHIHFAIWTNTFCNLDKYTLKFGQIHFAI